MLIIICHLRQQQQSPFLFLSRQKLAGFFKYLNLKPPKHKQLSIIGRGRAKYHDLSVASIGSPKSCWKYARQRKRIVYINYII